MARMPSRDCRCTADSGPLTGKAVLESSAQICSNRLSRSILRIAVPAGQRQFMASCGRGTLPECPDLEGKKGTAQ